MPSSVGISARTDGDAATRRRPPDSYSTSASRCCIEPRCGQRRTQRTWHRSGCSRSPDSPTKDSPTRSRLGGVPVRASCSRLRQTSGQPVRTDPSYDRPLTLPGSGRPPARLRRAAACVSVPVRGQGLPRCSASGRLRWSPGDSHEFAAYADDPRIGFDPPHRIKQSLLRGGISKSLADVGDPQKASSNPENFDVGKPGIGNFVAKLLRSMRVERHGTAPHRPCLYL